MATTTARCSDCNQHTPDHCASPACPWVECPTHKTIRLAPEAYRRLRGRG